MLTRFNIVTSDQTNCVWRFLIYYVEAYHAAIYFPPQIGGNMSNKLHIITSNRNLRSLKIVMRDYN